MQKLVSYAIISLLLSPNPEFPAIIHRCLTSGARFMEEQGEGNVILVSWRNSKSPSTMVKREGVADEGAHENGSFQCSSAQHTKKSYEQT